MNQAGLLADWTAAMPKAELHLHIDGTLQASRLLSLAAKNKVPMPYKSVEQVESAYRFSNLQSFLDLYYLGASVLKDEEDFYHLMMDYLHKCREQKIVHCEVMVEPQTYFPNGVSFATVMAGFGQAIAQARVGWGQSVLLILSFLRHLPEDEGLATLRAAEPFLDQFTGVGLASSELGNPPQKFQRLYARARDMGLRATVHAGEEGPAQFIWDGIKLLKAERIDHGVRCTEAPALVAYLKEHQIPLTVCPLSNVRLRVFDQLSQHNLLQLLELGVRVCVNSDDPAYFGGFVNENFAALCHDLNLSRAQAVQLARNSFLGSFLPADEKERFLKQLDAYCGPGTKARAT